MASSIYGIQLLEELVLKSGIESIDINGQDIFQDNHFLVQDLTLIEELMIDLGILFKKNY